MIAEQVPFQLIGCAKYESVHQQDRYAGLVTAKVARITMLFTFSR